MFENLKVNYLEIKQSHFWETLSDIVSPNGYENLESYHVPYDALFADYTTNKNKIKTNQEIFESLEDKFDKRTLNHAILGVNGFVAYETPTFKMNGFRPRKNDEFRVVRRVGDVSYTDINTISFNRVRSNEVVDEHLNNLELIRYAIKKTPHWFINARIEYRNKSESNEWQTLAQLETKTRIYKNEPTSLPEKYVKLEKILVVGLGAFVED